MDLSPLHAERLRRGWGRAKVASLLREAAARRGERQLATPKNLARMLQRYERQAHVREPAEPYRSLLCEVYGKPPAAFGWSDSPASPPPVRPVRKASNPLPEDPYGPRRADGTPHEAARTTGRLETAHGRTAHCGHPVSRPRQRERT